jgi:hypothetical protein
MSKKLTYEYVKEQIEKEDYQLLSDCYKNNQTKLNIKFPEGHEYKVTCNRIQRCLLALFKKCKEKGIGLMIIDEEIYNFNKEKCLDKIREFAKDIS